MSDLPSRRTDRLAAGEVRRNELASPEILRNALRETMRDILLKSEASSPFPGTGSTRSWSWGKRDGKTTTIGKLACHLKAEDMP